MLLQKVFELIEVGNGMQHCPIEFLRSTCNYTPYPAFQLAMKSSKLKSDGIS